MIAVVTGGATGIGHAIVTRLATDGADVIAVDCDGVDQCEHPVRSRRRICGHEGRRRAAHQSAGARGGSLRHPRQLHIGGFHQPSPEPRPDDVAGLVCYLASDAAGYINGAEIVIDGGATAGREKRSSRAPT